MSQQIRVLHVMRPAEGGLKKHLLELCRGLDNRRFQVFIAAPEGKQLAEELNASAVTVLPCALAGTLNPWKDLKALWQLICYIKKNRIQIVHTHGFKAGLLGRVAARLANVPVIITTSHNFIYDRRLNPQLQKVVVVVQKYLASWTDHIIAVSNALAQQIASMEGVPAEKITTIYNGICHNQTIPVADFHKKFIMAECRNIAVIARLIREKGVHMFIRMAAEVVKLFPEARFYIVGDGPERTNLEKLVANLKLTNVVIFLGFNKEAAALMPFFEIIVVPSLSEGLSIVALEAMFAKKAVVASNVGGLPEVVEHNNTGLLFEVGNVAEGAAQIIKLLQDQDLSRRLAEEAYKKACHSFTSEQMCRNTAALYERYIKTKILKSIQ